MAREAEDHRAVALLRQQRGHGVARRGDLGPAVVARRPVAGLDEEAAVPALVAVAQVAPDTLDGGEPQAEAVDCRRARRRSSAEAAAARTRADAQRQSTSSRSLVQPHLVLADIAFHAGDAPSINGQAAESPPSGGAVPQRGGQQACTSPSVRAVACSASSRSAGSASKVSVPGQIGLASSRISRRSSAERARGEHDPQRASRLRPAGRAAAVVRGSRRRRRRAARRRRRRSSRRPSRSPTSPLRADQLGAVPVGEDARSSARRRSASPLPSGRARRCCWREARRSARRPSRARSRSTSSLS